jgi:hypothetical protein
VGGTYIRAENGPGTGGRRKAENNVMRVETQRGEGRVGMIIALTIFLVAGFLAVKVVPVRVNAYEFREALREEAKYTTVHRDERQTLERILEKAESLNIPIDAKNVQIRRTKSEVIVSAKYKLPIDLKVTTYVYEFDEEMRAPIF